MTVINYINASLEIWGSIMSGIVVLCMTLSKRPKVRSDRVYLSCLACNVGISVFDVLALFFRGNPGVFCWWGVRISNYLAYSFGAGLLISFSYYLTEYIEMREQVSRRPLRIIRIVSVLYLLLIVLTQFYPIVYYIDAQNMYHRADLFWLSQIAGIAGLLLNGFLLIRHHRCLRRHETLALWSYILLPTAAMCVQIFVYGLSLLNMANTLCILVIFLFLQAEQGRISAERESQLAQSRIAILLSQIQPHFLYNTLTAICGLCDENPKEAKRVTAEFADYLRHNLEALKQSTPISFEDELCHTEVYLSIERKRFEEKLGVVYDIKTKDFCIPSLTIQPLVENAVKHGVLKRKKGGTITIAT
ncbi:MAG: histidine kinase, partial [Hungatella sp.]